MSKYIYIIIIVYLVTTVFASKADLTEKDAIIKNLQNDIVILNRNITKYKELEQYNTAQLSACKNELNKQIENFESYKTSQENLQNELTKKYTILTNNYNDRLKLIDANNDCDSVKALLYDFLSGGDK